MVFNLKLGSGGMFGVVGWSVGRFLFFDHLLFLLIGVLCGLDETVCMWYWEICSLSIAALIMFI